MKTYIDIIAENLVTNKKRLLRKVEIDTNKIKAELTPKQKGIFERIVERLGLKGKELTDTQEEAILFMALCEDWSLRNGFKGTIDRDSEEMLAEHYKCLKRIEKKDVKGVALLQEVLERVKDEAIKSRLFDLIVWLVILQDYFLHREGSGGDCGFCYASVDEMIATYAQTLGVSVDMVFSAVENLKKIDAIFEKRGRITLNFPFNCFDIEANKELQKELKEDELIDTAEGVYFIPQPFVTRYDL